MATNYDKAINTLNDLIEYCKDGQHGYQTAADDVKNTSLKTMFNNFAVQRKQFANELKDQVRNLGGDPDKGGHIAGTMHRGWIDLKSALNKGDEDAILTECERGDSAAVSAFESALKEELPAEVSNVVRRQYSEIQNVYKELQNMHKAVKQESK